MIFGLDAWIFWLILMVVFLVIELSTVNLVTIWFAGGCLGALIASLFQVSILWQILIAALLSGILLAICIIFKPFDKMKKKEAVPTNSDRAIGQIGLVEEEIDPIEGTGLVRVMGQSWSAVSSDGRPVKKGEFVLVRAIQGVKLVVSRQHKEKGVSSDD